MGTEYNLESNVSLKGLTKIKLETGL